MIELVVSVAYVTAIVALLHRWGNLMRVDLDMASEAILDRMSLCMYMTAYEIGARMMPALAEVLVSFAQAADSASVSMSGLEDSLRDVGRTASKLDMGDAT